MTQFPAGIDSDTDLPRVDNNITDIGALAINALRDSMFAVEGNIGINAQGATGSIAARLNQSLDPYGRILPSALAGIGLVYLPITDSEISPTAGIQESKLNLVYPTSTLYNLYQNLANSVNVLNGFLSLVGVKLEPHIDGTAYNHDLSAILVDVALQMLKTLPGSGVILPGSSIQNRNTANADLLVNDISNDLLTHEIANGTYPIVIGTGGSVPPQGFAHVATGLFIDTSSFSVIPQTSNSLQAFAEFVDSSSLMLIGSRTQNLFSNGVSVAARSSSLTADGYGQSIVPPTPIIAYLLDVPPGPMATSPVDDINMGDDVVLFQPTASQLSTFNFDAQFAQVSAGDLITINYGNGITAQFTVDSVKAIVNGLNRTYAVRLNAKNLYSSSNGMAQIDKPLYNTNKYGVLAAARAPSNVGALESLIIAHPRAAMVLGNGFNPSQLDSSHYNLYLTLFPNGDPTAPLPMPAVDVTGNKGVSPGLYTLDTVVDTLNTTFRSPGFNFRFIAFQYQGNFGIMLAESYNNAAFSIIAGTVNSLGQYTSTSNSSYPGNVVDNYGTGIYSIDALGLGTSGANLASPPPSTSYANIGSAQFAPSLLFYPKRSVFYYVNGVETDLLRSDPLAINQIEDGYGDGYWPATILPAPATMIIGSRVQVTYQINLDLATSGLKAGKTIVVQPAFPVSDPRYNFRDYGRFVIQSVVFSGACTSNPQTNIVVYDGVHAVGSSPAVTSTNIPVNVYFSDDSVAFNIENVADQSPTGLPYKRFFELYVNTSGHTWAHERARFTVPATAISNVNFYDVSPKLTGYQNQIFSGEYGYSIQLTINSFDATTGVFVGQLNNPSAPSVNYGPLTTGKQGVPVRFYDETNIDYIDFIFNATSVVPSWSSPLSVTIQVFPSLELDQEAFLLAGCQVSDVTASVSNLTDKRQFGNTSEQNFTTSALDYIAAPTRLMQANGIIRGFDIISFSGNHIQFDGGEAVVNGNILPLNPQNIELPAIFEAINGVISNSVNTITWFVCVNDEGELELIASTDYDPDGAFASQYAGLDNTRIFYGMNPNLASPVAYPIRGTYFGDLVLNQNDLTPIAVAVAVVTASSGIYSVSSLTVSDARRYVAGGYGGMADPFVLSNDGSFRSLNSVATWLTQLNNFVSASAGSTTFNGVGNTVIVKGEITISSPVTLNVKNPVTFVGDGGGFDVTSAQGIVVSSGVTFDGVRFDYTHTPTTGEGYSTANLVNSFNAAIYSAISSSAQDIAVRNCTFNSFASDHYPFVSFEFTGNQAVLQNVFIENNKVIDNAGVQDLRAAFVFNSKSGSVPATYPFSPKLNNCIIQNNKFNNDQMIVITAPRSGVAITPPFIACTNVRIVGNTCGTIGFITAYENPVITDNSAYDGFIHDKSDNLYINNNTCKFITNLDDNGQWVSFQTIASYAPGLGHSLNPSNPFEPATFVVTSVTIGNPTTITLSTTNPSAFTSGTLITFYSLTGITPSHIYQASITVTSSTVNSVTFTIPVSTSGSYSSGGYASVGFVQINNGTGTYTISQNTCNWIQTGACSDANGGGGGYILDNTMSPYNPAFLQNYTDTVCSVAPINAAIVLNPDSDYGNTYSFISGNVMTPKTDYSASFITYTYDQGILCFGSATIEDNTINSCVTSSLSNTYMIASEFGLIIRNNVLTRGTASINCYISSLGSPIFNPEFELEPHYVVTQNVFDSIYIDAANTITNETNDPFSQTSEYNYNINQVLYSAIPMYDMNTSVGILNTVIQPGLASGESPPTYVYVPVSNNSNIAFTSTVSNEFSGMVQVSPYVPAGATLLDVIVGIFTDNYNANNFNAASQSFFSLSAVKEPNATINLSSLTDSIVDVANNATYGSIVTTTTRYLLNTSGQVNNLYNATQYLQIALGSGWTIGKDSEVKLIFQGYDIVAGTNPVYLDTSPIVVRYTFQ